MLLLYKGNGKRENKNKNWGFPKKKKKSWMSTYWIRRGRGNGRRSKKKLIKLHVVMSNAVRNVVVLSGNNLAFFALIDKCN